MTEYNKVVYDGQTLIDLTQDDVQASDVRNGVYFHSADGVRSQGTLASTSVPTADTIAEFDSTAHMNSTDMTTGSGGEVEDFVNSLNLTKTLATVETKELLWTNANPTSAFASQTVACGGGYDSYEITFTAYAGQPNVIQTIRLSETECAMIYITGSTGYVGGSLYAFKRTCGKASNGVTFGAVYASADAMAWTAYSANTGCIPYKIYGCRLVSL